MKMFDCFPYFNEADVCEIRLHEMDAITDKFVIVEGGETYGGTKREYEFPKLLKSGRLDKFRDKIVYLQERSLFPMCTDRVAGRMREQYLRNVLLDYLSTLPIKDDDVISFGDCDEIPSAKAIGMSLTRLQLSGILRLKQHSFYYNVNTLVDYGHDWASRARIGVYRRVQELGTMYDFRMYMKNTCPGVENGGWHLSYFGGVERIKSKVAALSPFLSEYKLFGDDMLAKDIDHGVDLHHRKCELPKVFERVQMHAGHLPAYLTYERFPHFFRSEEFSHVG